MAYYTDKQMEDLMIYLGDCNQLCDFCPIIKAGGTKVYHSPNGYCFCEGRKCEEAFDNWIENHDEAEMEEWMNEMYE